MHFPITQEDTVTQTHKKEQIELVLRIMDSLEGVADDSARLMILRYLISTVIEDSDVLTAIQSELEEQSKQAEAEESEEETAEEGGEEEDEFESPSRPSMNADIGMPEETEEEPE